MLTPRERALAQSLAEKARFERMAGCTWPIRSLFQDAADSEPRRRCSRPGRRGAGRRSNRRGLDDGPRDRKRARGRAGAARRDDPAHPRQPRSDDHGADEQRYGEITLLDYPQWMKDNFSGLTRMDIFSGFFGDMVDEAMYFAPGSPQGSGFDPLSPAGRKWLDALANTLVKTGTKVQHISNNAPFGLADFGSPEADTRRKAGVAMAKRWIEGCAVLGPVSMRMNSPQALAPRSGRTRFRAAATVTRATSRSCRSLTLRSSRTRKWRTSAASLASRSRSRTTGASRPIR